MKEVRHKIIFIKYFLKLYRKKLEKKKKRNWMASCPRKVVWAGGRKGRRQI